jgi:hypothetical protein
MNKKIIFFAFGLAFFLSIRMQAQISPGIFGQNADLTDYIQAHHAYGSLNTYWASPTNYISDSKTKFMRYGGIAVEQYCLIDGDPNISTDQISKTIVDYIAKAKAMMDDGITPMMTLPLNGAQSLALTAIQAGKLVKGVNDGLVGASYAPVLYWVYSNEPEGSVHGYVTTTAATDIYNYIVAYWTAIYNGGTSTYWNNAWGTPQFVGPELYSYDNYPHTGGIDQLVQHLLAGPGYTNHATDITPYISIFSWHFYPFLDESTPNTGFPDPTRSNVIGRLTSGDGTNPTILTHYDGTYGNYPTKSLKTNINEAQTWISSYSTNHAVKIAITEANICAINDVSGTYGTGGTDDLLTGNGANSFIAGQFWAEMMGICMQEGVQVINFWSSITGCTGTGCPYPLYSTNVGFLNSDPNRCAGVGSKKPTYYHFQMLANNFNGTFSAGSVSTGQTDFKGFGSYDGNHIAVMIMNQHATTSSYSYHLRLDNTYPSTGTVKIKIPGPNLNVEYTGTIDDQSTTLLIFDLNGNLSSKTDYKLSDGCNPPLVPCLTAFTCINQMQFEAYAVGVHTSITIGGTGTGQGPISLNATHSTIFKASGTIEITGAGGAFSSNGQTLSLTPTPCQ